MKIAVFKSEDEKGFEKYSSLLEKSQIQVELVPTIDFQFKNLDGLSRALKSPETYSGIIFTSPRCVRAVKMCDLDLGEWKSKQSFSVGETTFSAANQELGLETIGRESGNAAALSEVVVKTLASKLPLLFPCGNLKQDTLQKNLEKAGIGIEPVEVYETIQHRSLRDHLLRILANDQVDGLVFFSPSGVKFCCEISQLSLTKKKLVSIGPSTTRALENGGLEVHATAESPTPEGLLRALLTD